MSEANLTKFKKGEGGRPAGAKNKLTTTVRDTVLKVFEKAQNDPALAKYSLEAFMKRYPRDFYNIAARLIPMEVVGTIDHNVTWNEERNYKGIDQPNPTVIDIDHEEVNTSDSAQSAP